MEGAGRAYLDGFATAWLVLQHDGLTAGEILDSLYPQPESDRTIHPWRRGYKAAIRAAFGR